MSEKRLGPGADCEIALQDGVLKFKEPVRELLSASVKGTIINAFTPGQPQQVWKRTVASAVKRVRGSAPWDPQDFCAVTLVFCFFPGNHRNQELDVENYVKPVVDAVAAGLFLEEETDPSEIETWDFPDSNFRTLLIHRAADATDEHEEGVRITLSVRKPQPDRPPVRPVGNRFPIGAATIVETLATEGSNSRDRLDGNRLACRSELERCVKEWGAYRAMGSAAYHTDPTCFWGPQIKLKNLYCGSGRDGTRCASCRSPA